MLGENRIDKNRTRESNPVTAAKALTLALPGNEPLVSLNALAGHLDRMRSQDVATPAQALEIAELVDRAGQPHFAVAEQRYVSDERRLTRFQEEQLWNNVVGYVAQLQSAYRHCLGKYQSGAPGSELLTPSLALIGARAMRLGVAQVKWSLLRYRRVQPTLWREICELYRFAESGGFAKTRMPIHGAATHRSSVEEEFLKALLLAVTNPESLRPKQIEIADRLIGTHAHRFVIGEKKGEHLRHYVDLSADSGPVRIDKDMPHTASVRMFGAGGTLAQFQGLLAEFEEEQFKPTTRRLIREFDAESVRVTLKHLMLHWGTTPPLRRHKRLEQDERVDVLHDIKDITAHVAGLTAGYPYKSDYESWRLENESRSGLRMTIESPQGQWLKVNALVAFRRPGDASWRTGIVRRLSERGETRSAGVEIISQGGAGVTFLPLATRSRPQLKSVPGLLCALLSTGGARDEVTLLLPPTTFSPTAAQEMRAYDQRYRLVPLRLIASGDGYEIARYRVLRVAD